MTYPYQTRALLADEKWHKVTVVGRRRTVAVATRAASKGHVGMHLVEVLVEGETKCRDIATERLELQP